VHTAGLFGGPGSVIGSGVGLRGVSPVSSNAGAIGRFAPSPPSAGGLFSAAQQHAAAQTQQQQILLQQQQQLLAQQHQNAMKAGMQQGLAMGGGGAGGGGQLGGGGLNPGGMNPGSGGFGNMLGRPPAVPTPGALQRPGSSLAGSGPGMQQVPCYDRFLCFLVPFNYLRTINSNMQLYKTRFVACKPASHVPC